MATFCSECKKKGKTVLSFSKGFCTSHQYLKPGFDKRSINQRAIDREKETPSENKPHKAPRFPSPIQSPTEQEIMEIRACSVVTNGIYTDMQAFWNYAEMIIVKTGSVCWECSDTISRADYRNSTGHIFPKSIFGSVAAHPYNFVVVGCRCGCHHKTHTLSTFSQMSIFTVAVQRYLKFGHLITENHKYLDLFLDYANQLNQ